MPNIIHVHPGKQVHPGFLGYGVRRLLAVRPLQVLLETLPASVHLSRHDPVARPVGAHVHDFPHHGQAAAGAGIDPEPPNLEDLATAAATLPEF